MWRWLAMLLLASVIYPRGAQAGEPSEADRKRARDLFAQATKQEADEDYRAALETLKQVAAIKSTPVVLYHMANCEDHLGKLAEALEHFQRSNDLAVEQNAEVQKLAPEKIAALRDRAPRISIEVTPRVDNTEVLLDGVVVSPEKLKDLRVNPDQPYALQIRAPGRQTFDKTINLKERGVEALHVDLKILATKPAGAEPEGAAAVPPAPDTATSERSVLPLVVGGAAAAVFLGVGIVTTLVANGKGSDSAVLRSKVLGVTGQTEAQAEKEGSCPNGPQGFKDKASAATLQELARQCDALSSSESSRLTFQGIAIGGYIAAGAALAGGTIWYFVQPGPSKGGSGSVRVAPMLSRSLSGVVVTGRF